jgi:hypothetical protein
MKSLTNHMDKLPYHYSILKACHNEIQITNLKTTLFMKLTISASKLVLICARLLCYKTKNLGVLVSIVHQKSLVINTKEVLMKKYIGLLLLGGVLTGCQSTGDGSEQMTAIKPACEIGDDYDDKSASWEAYRQSLIDCGGFDIFTDDIVAGTKVSRVNNSGKYRAYEFMADGSGKYTGKDVQPITWAISQDGFIEVTFEDGWKMYWALMAEQENNWSIKIYDRDASDSEQYIWASNLKIESMAP